MTPRSLFNIILKILGLFFIRDIVVGLSQFVVQVMSLVASHNGLYDILFGLFAGLLFLAIYVLISFCLIFKSDWVIKRLRLQNGFDEETIPLNIHRSTVLIIAVIVTGGLLVVEGLPNLCKQLYDYFEQRALMRGTLYQGNTANPNISYAVLAGVRIIVGLTLMAESRRIVLFIERKRIGHRPH